MYLSALRDPSVPMHRVVRKTAAVTLALVGFLFYYRHGVLGFGFREPFLKTWILAFLTVGVVGIFGGLMAGGFYESFLKSVSAQRTDVSISVFFAEWLFALTAPFFGVALFVISSWVGG
jgi:hypothetical protein